MFWLRNKKIICLVLALNLKGAATLMITMFHMKDLNIPCILILVSSKSVEKYGNCRHLKYLQRDCNGSGNIVGLVTSHSLIKYA